MTFLAVASAAGTATSTPAANDVQAGVLGFLVVAGIGVALVFLLRSMNKQFKKIGPKPEDPGEALPEQEDVAGDDAPLESSAEAAPEPKSEPHSPEPKSAPHSPKSAGNRSP